MKQLLLARLTKRITLRPPACKRIASLAWARTFAAWLALGCTVFGVEVYSDSTKKSDIYKRAEAKHKNGDFDAAIADYTLVVKKSPKSYEAFAAYINRGSAREEKGDHDAAIADFSKAMEINPQLAAMAGILQSRAVAKRRKGDLIGALADYDKQVKSDPKDTVALHLRAEFKMETGDTDGAKADYLRALQLNSTYSSVGNLELQKIAEKSSLEEAIADYNRYIDLVPKNVQLRLTRGVFKRKNGDLEGAIADFSNAIELDPKLSGGYVNRGLTRYLQQEWEKAITDYEGVVAHAPKSSGFALLRLYALRIKLGQVEAAGKELRRSLESGSKLNEWDSKISAFLLGETDEKALLTGADTGQPKLVRKCEAWYYSGIVHLGAGRKSDAAESFKKCVAIEPGNANLRILAAAELKWLEQGK